MTEPRTEAGRQLLAGMPSRRDRGLRGAILAIEAEARVMSLRDLLRYRHGISAWDGDNLEGPMSMFRAAAMPWCLWCWRDHR